MAGDDTEKRQSESRDRQIRDGQPAKIQGPIYQADQAQPGTGNKEFLANYVASLLKNAFANLKP